MYLFDPIDFMMFPVCELTITQSSNPLYHFPVASFRWGFSALRCITGKAPDGATANHPW
jgi:hypothetical protein